MSFSAREESFVSDETKRGKSNVGSVVDGTRVARFFQRTNSCTPVLARIHRHDYHYYETRVVVLTLDLSLESNCCSTS